MADISKIQLSDNTQFNLKDATARNALSENDTSTGDISKIQLSDNTQYNIKDAQARQDIETVTTDVKAQVNADKDLINGGTAFIDDETLDDYDDKIAEMQEAYKKFIPIQTTSGTEIQLDNSNNDKALVDIGLEGNTEQETTTGKNKFDSSTVVAGDIAGGATTVRLSSRQVLWLETGTYTFSTNQTSPLRFVVLIENKGVPPLSTYPTYILDSGWQTSSSYTFTISTAGYCVIGFSKENNAELTVNDIANFNYQLETGSTATDYEKFTNGASPNPDYPQEVKVVTGENTINIVGRNLINPNSPYGTSLGITTTYNSENQSLSFSGTTTGTWAYLTNKINVNIPKGEYTFSINKTVSAHTVIFRMFYNETQYQDVTIYANTTSRTFDITNDTISYQIYMGGLSAGISLNNTLNFQIEKGSTASPCEKRQSQSYPINLGSLELAKISTYKDKIYKDDNDKKWYLRKYIAKVILDSTKRDGGGTTGTNAYFIRTNIFGLNDNTVALSYSNMFQPCSFNDRVNGLDITYMQNGQLNIRTANNTTIDWSDNTKRDAWLDANKPIVYYVLATPIEEEEITNEALIEQLEAVKLLSGTQNNFTIDADTLPTLNLNYIGEANPHL